MADIVESDVTRFIRESGGLLDAFTALVDQEVKKNVEKTSRTTVADRRALHLETIQEQNLEQIKELKATARQFLDLVSKVDAINLEFGDLMTTKQKVDMMKAYLGSQKIKEFAETWREVTKRVVFDHITAERMAAKVEFPEYQNGSVEVPTLGKRFCKEGNGRKDPSLDEKKLKELLGSDLWGEVVDIDYVPAKRVQRLSLEKLMQAAEQQPEILEKIRESLVVGEFKSPSFTVRDMGKQVKQNDDNGSV